MVSAGGNAQGDIDIPDAMQRLEQHISTLPVLYKKFNADELLLRPAPGKWSRKEILGHLIDSAINNLKRFNEIQFLPQPYRITPYKQNDLGVVNNYQHLPVEHLLQLWQSLNRQISYAVENIPAEKFNLV